MATGHVSSASTAAALCAMRCAGCGCEYPAMLWGEGLRGESFFRCPACGRLAADLAHGVLIDPSDTDLAHAHVSLAMHHEFGRLWHRDHGSS